MLSTQSLALTELLPSNPELQLGIEIGEPCSTNSTLLFDPPNNSTQLLQEVHRIIVLGGLLAFVHDGSHIKFQVLHKSLAT